MVKAEELVTKFSNIKTNRAVWESHWEEIAERILPRQTGFLGNQTPGEKKTQRIFDSRPQIALDRFAAVMDSMLTPRQQKWHNLKTTNSALNKDHDVQDYFYEVNSILYSMRYAPKANFASQNFERWVSMGAFGTGTLFVDFDASEGLRYRCVNLKNTYFLENHQGIVDTVYREFKFTARQAVQRWGDKMMPERIMRTLDSPTNNNQEFSFIHVVMPRLDYQKGNIDASGMPWASFYIAVEDKQLVSPVGGYISMPYSISRYVTAPDEVYGRSPAMTSLPDIKMLNEMAKTDIRAVHKLVDPPLLLNDDGILGGAMSVNLTPGGLNVGGIDSSGNQLIKPLQTGARVDIAEAKMEQRRQSIDNAFLVTLFQILVETPRMTATEALLRAQEKGMLLTPVIGRQHSEALGPQIERELTLLQSHRVLPPMPDALLEAGADYDIIYDSPLSRMQRAEELVGVQRTTEILSPFAQIDPTIFDIFNTDELARLTAEVSGVPMTIVRSPDELAKIREQRQAAQDQAAQVEQGATMASTMKDAAHANQLLTAQ